MNRAAPPEIDREAPTPRVSNTFSLLHERALELGELLGGTELRLSRDLQNLDRLEWRHGVALRTVALEFAKRFERWEREPLKITDARRESQLRQFNDFEKSARGFIDEHSGERR